VVPRRRIYIVRGRVMGFARSNRPYGLMTPVSQSPGGIAARQEECMAGPYRDLLVFLSASDSASARLDAAIALATEHGARLTGVDVSTDAVFESDLRERATGLKDDFERRLKAAGLRGVFRTPNRSDSVAWKALYAHYADLVIAPTVNEAAARLVLPAVPEEVLVSAGVPMLLIPDLWTPEPLGRKVMVAWNGSREATRALHDALPLLARAEAVTLFAYDSRQAVMQQEMDLLVAHLAEHGVAARPFTWPASGDVAPIDALFSCLSEDDADLIVAGGYGHSRWLEHLFGGVSEALASTLVVPVLMSH
jgi:nucleotide-binding universal stress UspA family protein